MGGLGFFYLAPAEIILSAGIVAFLGLIFILGLKYLELLPAKEQVREGAEEATEESKEAPEPTEGYVAATGG